jgi:hypothetical protein
MTGIAGCCARVASDQAAAALPRTVMKCRRLMPTPSWAEDSIFAENIVMDAAAGVPAPHPGLLNSAVVTREDSHPFLG